MSYYLVTVIGGSGFIVIGYIGIVMTQIPRIVFGVLLLV